MTNGHRHNQGNSFLVFIVLTFVYIIEYLQYSLNLKGLENAAVDHSWVFFMHFLVNQTRHFWSLIGDQIFRNFDKIDIARITLSSEVLSGSQDKDNLRTWILLWTRMLYYD